MPILPPTPGPVPAQKPGGTCSYKALDVIMQAMQEIGVLDPNETPTGPEGATGLLKLNRMLDSWNADGRYVYATVFQNFTITPNLQPHTIGPSGTFAVNQRPTQLLAANIILNSGSPQAVRQPVQVRDEDWWASKSSYAVVSTFPTDVYYSADWPNGSLYLWPVPNTAYPLELEFLTVLEELQLNSAFCMPPGYMDAVVYSLAIALCPSFSVAPSQALMLLASKAIARIQGLNVTSPRIGTRDAGVPSGGKARPSFNWLTGQNR
jgi:hypothetical protein